MERLEVDVCVVGAGFAGMAAAWQLHKAGVEVAVLEARDRTGGRTFTTYLDDGTQIDHGGAWFGPGQDRAYGLAAEMGRPTYPTFYEGSNLLIRGGKQDRYSGLMPHINPLKMVDLGQAMKRMEHMANKLDPEAPWEAPSAREWDRITVADWIHHNLHSHDSRSMLEGVWKIAFGCDPAEISLLCALFFVATNDGYENMGNVKDGHQQDRVLGGTQSILEDIRERLDGRVHLERPVTTVAWSDDKVEVTAIGATVKARRAIVAVPQWLTQRIWWSPALPHDRAQLVQRVPPGHFYKISVVYDTPFWREDGLNGQSFDIDSPVTLTLDGCGPEPPPGVLVVIAGGPGAYELARLEARERRRAVVATLRQRFGAQAEAVREYFETDWVADEWSQGDFCSHFPPGVLTSFGPALRKPAGPLHWAGTDNATHMFSCIDGAIRSGERAADEVMATLGSAVAAPSS